ncbi:MAG TPA: T9SS type A sorting domain-containing protein [Chitinophagales bacterium]|nr:T9SS type A sorting domain-containing protein [Chitinophagales bacterium]
MKSLTTKKFFFSILLLSGMFSFTVANAQTCSGNKVWTCRTCTGPYGTTYQECDCVSPNKVAAWQATPCSYYDTGNNGNHGNGNNGNGHDDGGACICRLNESGAASESIYPNPLSNSTTIYFTLNEPQKVSLKIFDLNGRLIQTLADDEFDSGEHQVEWNASNLEAGIYFLRMETATNSMNRKLIGVK